MNRLYDTHQYFLPDLGIEILLKFVQGDLSVLLDSPDCVKAVEAITNEGFSDQLHKACLIGSGIIGIIANMGTVVVKVPKVVDPGQAVTELSRLAVDRGGGQVKPDLIHGGTVLRGAKGLQV